MIDQNLCVDIKDAFEELQYTNPQLYHLWYKKLYPIEPSTGQFLSSDEWTPDTLVTLRKLIHQKPQ